MSDDSEQSDEIFSRESICGGETFVCDTSRTPYSGHISIELCKAKKWHTLDLVCNEQIFQFPYLPPLLLRFSLPSDYPLSNPPYFSLDCIWLNSEHVEKLTSRLVEIWNDNCNGVVLFAWLELLKYETISFVDIQFPHPVEEAALCNVKQYLYDKKEAAFAQGRHRCPMCFVEKPGTECVLMMNCDHFSCKRCLTEYLTRHIGATSVAERKPLKCPDSECEADITFKSAIEILLSKEAFESYDQSALQNTLGVTHDMHFCPRPLCSKPVISEKSKKFGQCNACDFAFCFRCRLGYHGVDLCSDLKKSTARSTTGGGATKVACPGCKTKNDRPKDLDLVICSECTKHFCCLCLKVLLKKFSLKHFVDGVSQCTTEMKCIKDGGGKKKKHADDDNDDDSE